MVKNFLTALKAVRKQSKIAALNKIIELSCVVRDKAKARALEAQAKRDELLAVKEVA